jgi:hypothetical protein
VFFSVVMAESRKAKRKYVRDWTKAVTGVNSPISTGCASWFIPAPSDLVGSNPTHHTKEHVTHNAGAMR